MIGHGPAGHVFRIAKHVRIVKRAGSVRWRQVTRGEWADGGGVGGNRTVGDGEVDGVRVDPRRADAAAPLAHRGVRRAQSVIIEETQQDQAMCPRRWHTKLNHFQL